VLNQVIKGSGTLLAFKVGFDDGKRLENAFSPLNPSRLADTADGRFWARVGTRQPVQVTGFSPIELTGERRQSLARVIQKTRARDCRPRAKVEREFAEWYTLNKKVKRAKRPSNKPRRRVNKEDRFWEEV
jgi:hypothetical protein